MSQKPYDQSADRRSTRNRRLAGAMISGLVLRGFAALAPLLLVPMMLDALGPVLFGIWATLASITAILSFSDIGIGSSLLTALSHEYGLNNWERARIITASAYLTTMLAAVLGILVTLVITLSGGLGRVFATKDVETSLVSLAIVIPFFLSIPAGLVVRIQFAVQQGTRSNLWTALATLAPLPAVWLLAAQGASAVVLVLGAATSALGVQILNTVSFFALGLGKIFRPRWGSVSRAEMWSLVKLGSGFAFLTLLSAVSLNIDNVLISAVQGPLEVTGYAPVARLFASVILVITVVGIPLWAAVGEALARGDMDWVHSAVMKFAFGLAGLAGILGGFLVLVRVPLMQFWLDSSIPTPFPMFVGFATWMLLIAFAAPFFMVQNALGYLKPQFIGWLAFLLVSSILKIVALYRGELQLLPWVSSVCFLATVLPAAVVGYRNGLRGRPSQGASLTNSERAIV